MNHQPFEDWLLEEKPLNRADKRQLEEHLRTCNACRSLAEVNLALHTTRQVSPAAGFSGRFQERLAAQRKLQHRRAFWGFFILGLCVLGAVTWLSWPLLVLVVDSPARLVGGWVNSLVSMWVSIQAVLGTGWVFLKVLPGFIPPTVWTVAVLALASLATLWVASMTKFAKLSQGV